MHKGHFAKGTVEGTGATIIIQCGFTPQWVKLINIDGDCFLEWTDDMDDASGMKTIAAGTTAQVTTLGVTPYAGTVGANSLGFQIGADTDVNVSAETLMWVAVSGDS